MPARRWTRSIGHWSGWTTAPTASASPRVVASLSPASKRFRGPSSAWIASSVSSGHAASGPRPVPRWLAPSIVVGVVLLDQLTKIWVVASLSDGPLSIIGTDVELHLVRNSGGAFSTFTTATVVLA